MTSSTPLARAAHSGDHRHSVHRALTSLLCLALAVAAGCAPRQQSELPPLAITLAITDVTLIDVERGERIPRQTVLIAGKRIHAVAPAERTRVPAGAHVIDGRGQFLVPGLIDTHLHVAWAFGTDEFEPLLRGMLANGLTTIRDAAGTGRERGLVEHARRVDRGEVLSPRLFVSGTVSHRTLARHEVPDLTGLLRVLGEIGVDGFKILRGLTDDEIRLAVAEAERFGVPVYGHTYDWQQRDSAGEYTLEAVRMGVRGVMHVQGIPQLGSRDPRTPPAGPRFGGDNWPEWWLFSASAWLHSDPVAERALIDTMVARGVWLEPTLITEEWVVSGERFRAVWDERRLPGSYDAVRAGFPTYGGDDLARYRAAYDRMRDFVRRFHEAGGTVIAGTDCLPACGHGLPDELALLVEAGLTPAAALRAGTIDAARALGWETRIGTIEPEKLADLLLLSADPLDDVLNTRRIAAVVAGGRYMDANALEAIRSAAGGSADERIVAAAAIARRLRQLVLRSLAPRDRSVRSLHRRGRVRDGWSRRRERTRCDDRGAGSCSSVPTQELSDPSRIIESHRCPAVSEWPV